MFAPEDVEQWGLFAGKSECVCGNQALARPACGGGQNQVYYFVPQMDGCQ